MITLHNRERKLVQFEIPVSVNGGVRLHFARVERVGTTTPSKSVNAVARKFPTTLTLTARDTKGSVSEPLPDDVASIPAIAKAIAERRLAVTNNAQSAAPRAEKE